MPQKAEQVLQTVLGKSTSGRNVGDIGSQFTYTNEQQVSGIGTVYEFKQQGNDQRIWVSDQGKAYQHFSGSGSKQEWQEVPIDNLLSGMSGSGQEGQRSQPTS